MSKRFSTCERVEWVDAAKAISIILVVYTHVVSREFWLNQELIFLRMPLFFFASGIFAAKAIHLPLRDFLSRKIGRLLYLYVLWSIILLVSTDMLYSAYKGRPVPLEHLLSIFVEPTYTIWFLYALAIAFVLARVTRAWPAWLVIAAAACAYAVAVGMGDWNSFSFPDRLARQTLYFLLAVRYGQLILSLIPRLSKYWLFPIVAYLPLAMLSNATVLGKFAPITFTASMCGVMGVMSMCQYFRQSRAVLFLTRMGRQTFFVYVMHRIPLFAGFLVAGYIGVIDQFRAPLTGIFVTAGLCALCLWLGTHIVRPYFPWLEQPFWLLRRDRRFVSTGIAHGDRPSNR